MIFVDTNYFLRFLLEDIDEQSARAKRLFMQGAEGEVELATSLIVVFELYWVLTSFYKRKRKQVADILVGVLKMRFIELEWRGLLEEAIKAYVENNLDLEDAFNLVYAKDYGCTELRTFDKKLQRAFKAS